MPRKTLNAAGKFWLGYFAVAIAAGIYWLVRS